MSVRTGIRDDAGISLAELLVAMALTSIVMVMVVSFFLGVTRSLNREALASTSSETASLGMRELTRVLRSGTEIEVKDQPVNTPVFVVAGPQTVTFFAFLDTNSATPAPVRVRFAVSAAGNLVETRWAAVPVDVTFWGFSTTVLSQRTITRWIVPTPGAAGAGGAAGATVPVFQYLDAAGTLLPATAATPLTAVQIAQVASVRITLTVQSDPSGRAQPTTIENTVGMPNLGVSRLSVAP